MAPGSGVAMRFISPDGRPLGQLLDANGNRHDADAVRVKRISHKSRKGGSSKAEKRWDRAMEQGGGGGGGGGLSGARSEADAMELEVNKTPVSHNQPVSYTSCDFLGCM